MKSKEELRKQAAKVNPAGLNWQPAYTWVLMANAVYILVFWIIMKFFE